MSVRILNEGSIACLYDSTTDIAFGPVFYGEYDAREQALHFLDWLDTDARTFTPANLATCYAQWRSLFTNDEGELTAKAHQHAVSLT